MVVLVPIVGPQFCIGCGGRMGVGLAVDGARGQRSKELLLFYFLIPPALGQAPLARHSHDWSGDEEGSWNFF
jgi:hypothetical protein